MTRVAGPRNEASSSLFPTRRMVLPDSATASAIVPCSSPVYTRPFTIRRSAEAAPAADDGGVDEVPQAALKMISAARHSDARGVLRGTGEVYSRA